MILKVLDNSLSRVEDNILRLDRSTFARVSFILLDAGLYADPSPVVSGSVARLQGYAEWVSNTQPAISVGFDWTFRFGELDFDGEPFANFVLQSMQGEDLSNEESFAQIKASLESIAWQSRVLSYLAQEYQ
ncbi:hypothetical protein VII00023_10714 [Vibrio ichthyoenteri ATCC 700023]|uniref:Uncharacterized protein n=1 Tax=Vibrio ichthyoenteri ATCC 700023 TaxID=870968 RepID=F9S8W9_9VIBR|nr:DUF4902 domain-containing protein [Vibrio ichthyoenteri]EGU29211.1 hypothetical protein VII00023_10714 [Vibrio ichthyoenteri ATCC 700023]